MLRELSAFFFALRWIAYYLTDEEVLLEYDSEYAAGITRKSLPPHDNVRLALGCRALDMATASITWRKAISHTGLHLNDRADILAKCGAAGIVRGNMPLWYGLPELDI